ncbi:MAG TPA: hypothetical protein VHV78_08310 [Gemmatimonadaceae bacterium]|nr:hypothetical protein [Gemmatimonadaceae bacterium]
MKRIALVFVAMLASSGTALSQTRISVGLGGGIAGSTDESLSDGKGAPVVMGAVTSSVLPLVALGAEVDYWRRSEAQSTIATGILQVHIPVLPLFLKVGVGYGSGDPNGGGNISGITGQVGAAYDLALPVLPVAFTLFGNAFLAHGSARSLQMVDGGLALTWR